VDIFFIVTINFFCV